MSRISSVLEKYEPKPEDEKRFVDKHVVQKHDDVAKNSEDTFKGGNKSKTRKADYEDGEDEDVYENTLYRLKGDLTEEQLEVVLGHLEEVKIDEDVYNSFITSIVEEVYEQATDDEKAALDEMLASDEGYEEILEMIAEACDCDDEEDDEGEEDDDNEDEDEDDVKEETQARWQVTFKKVKTLQRPVTVTARNTSEAIKKAEALAKKNHDLGSVALQHTDVKKLSAV